MFDSIIIANISISVSRPVVDQPQDDSRYITYRYLVIVYELERYLFQLAYISTVAPLSSISSQARGLYTRYRPRLLIQLLVTLLYTTPSDTQPDSLVAIKDTVITVINSLATIISLSLQTSQAQLYQIGGSLGRRLDYIVSVVYIPATILSQLQNIV